MADDARIKSSIVRGIYQTLIKKDTLRRIFAAAFLIVLLAEWGSHAVVNASPIQADERTSATAHQSGHDDPCQTLVLCSDSKRKDQQMPNLGHDACQHNALLDRLAGFHQLVALSTEPSIPFSNAKALSRPPDPAFHPPQIS